MSNTTTAIGAGIGAALGFAKGGAKGAAIGAAAGGAAGYLAGDTVAGYVLPSALAATESVTGTPLLLTFDQWSLAYPESAAGPIPEVLFAQYEHMQSVAAQKAAGTWVDHGGSRTLAPSDPIVPDTDVDTNTDTNTTGTGPGGMPLPGDFRGAKGNINMEAYTLALKTWTHRQAGETSRAWADGIANMVGELAKLGAKITGALTGAGG